MLYLSVQLHCRNTPLDIDLLKTIKRAEKIDDHKTITQNIDYETHSVKFVLMAHISGSDQRFQAIRKTWFKTNTVDLGLVLIAGDRVSGHTLINSPSMPGQAWDNTKAGFSTALRSYPFAEYIGKFDDDTYVYTRELVRQITYSDNSTAPRYWGYPMKWSSHFTYAQGGAGYILTRDAARLILTCSPPPDVSEFEDVSVGYCMFQAGVAMIDMTGLHPHHPYQMIRWDKYGHPSDRVHTRERVEGYMNPLTYHYINPSDMTLMHDDVYLHGFPMQRKVPTIPRTIHQFWEGSHRPEAWIMKCRDTHPHWEHITWNNSVVRQRFPSNENHNGMLWYDWQNGRLCNQDFYDSAKEKNLMSDILRYEVLMFYGGMHVDADMECFKQADSLLQANIGISQGLAFLERDKITCMV